MAHLCLAQEIIPSLNGNESSQAEMRPLVIIQPSDRTPTILTSVLVLSHCDSETSTAGWESACTGGARWTKTPSPASGPVRVAWQASELFLDDLLQHVSVEREAPKQLLTLWFSSRNCRSSRTSLAP